MCFIKPLRVKKINKTKAYLENNIEAFYDKRIGKIKVGDLVLVYGNLVLNRVRRGEKKDEKSS